MRTIVKLASVLLCAALLSGCASKSYPADTSSIIYANRASVGSKLQVKGLLVPQKMNIIYFYADW